MRGVFIGLKMIQIWSPNLNHFHVSRCWQCHHLSVSDTDSILGGATAQPGGATTWTCCPATVPPPNPAVPPLGPSGTG
ncbi:unnamed protein product, partial [Musa textilis]